MSAETTPPLHQIERLRSMLAETLGLSWIDFQFVQVPLYVTLNDVTTSDQVDHQVPADYDMLVFQIDPLLALNELGSATEEVQTATAGATGLGGARNRMLMKALNSKITLVDLDRKNVELLQMTDRQGGFDPTLCLASLMPMGGGGPIKFYDDEDLAPMILKRNTKIQLKAEWVQTAYGYGDTDIGIVLQALLIKAVGT